MKKGLVAVMLVLGLVTGGHAAFATAVVVDFTTLCYTNTVFTVIGITENGDEDGNAMKDGWELNLLENALADVGAVGHDPIHTAWDANKALFLSTPMPLLPNPLPSSPPIPAFAQGQVPTWAMVMNMATYAFLGGAGTSDTGGTAFANYMAGKLTIGNADGASEVVDLLTTDTTILALLSGVYTSVGLGGAFASAYAPWAGGTIAGFDLSGAPFIGKNGDSDGDTFDNFTEYGAASDGADYVTRATRNDPPALSGVAISGATGTKIEGTNVTLTATATGGTPPVSYVWKKGVATVGTGTTLSFTPIALGDAGDYTVEATDSAAVPVTVTDTATLTVDAIAPMPVAGAWALTGLGLAVLALGASALTRMRRRA